MSPVLRQGPRVVSQNVDRSSFVAKDRWRILMTMKFPLVLGLLSTGLWLGCRDEAPGEATDSAVVIDATIPDAGAEPPDAGAEPADLGPVNPDATVDPIDAGEDADGGAPSCPVAPVTLTHGPERPATALIRKFSMSQYPDAVCNDGTPAYIGFRPGVGGGARRWLLYMQGGGSCYRGESCAERFAGSRRFMSSNGFNDGDPVPVDRLSGILSADPAINPDFFDANLVFMAYCSSDQWAGTQAATPGITDPNDVRRWHFRGRAIVNAAWSELFGLGLRGGDEVLLVGTSAGGLGVTSVLDDLQGTLPNGTRLLALIDGSYFLEYPPYDSSTMSEATSTDDILNTLAAADQVWRSQGDASCLAAATDAASVARCSVTAQLFARRELGPPTMIRQSQQDATMMARFVEPRDVSAPAQAYRDRLAAAMRVTFADLDPRYHLFSTFDDLHTVVIADRGWVDLSVDGTRLREAVGAWYRDPCAPGPRRVGTP